MLKGRKLNLRIDDLNINELKRIVKLAQTRMEKLDDEYYIKPKEKLEALLFNLKYCELESLKEIIDHNLKSKLKKINISSQKLNLKPGSILSMFYPRNCAIYKVMLMKKYPKPAQHIIKVCWLDKKGKRTSLISYIPIRWITGIFK